MVQAEKIHPIAVGLTAVIAAVTDEVPRFVTVDSRAAVDAVATPDSDLRLPAREAALPFGELDPVGHRTLERALREWVREQTGLELGYVEQLYTFGDRFRDPTERRGGPRLVSVAYLALVREAALSGTSRASWRPSYDLFPWEDWRAGRPAIISGILEPALERWTMAASDSGVRQVRRQRADIAFGFGGVSWDGERVLERYELLWEAGLVAEAIRDARLAGLFDGEDLPAARPIGSDPLQPRALGSTGPAMAMDHRRIVATALGRLRGKIKYRPVVFELVPPTFTLLQLQRVVEALAGVRLHKQNFRRLVERGGLVEGTGRYETQTRGRPAELFRFRREVLRERPAPGVGLPVERRGEG